MAIKSGHNLEFDGWRKVCENGGVIQNWGFKIRRLLLAAGIGVLLFFSFASYAQIAPRKSLHGHVPAVVARLAPLGRLPATNRLSLAIGLPLRNQAELNELLAQLQDPHSTNFHKFLMTAEFTARFGPAESDYQAVTKFAEANGLTVTGTHPNRVVLDVEGSVSNVEQAFQVTLRTYHHPTEARDFFAPDTEPSVDADVPVLSVSGLDNLSLPHPKSLIPEKNISGDATPQSGSGPSGSYAGHDFRAAYVPGATLDGSGQSVALLEFDGYYANDITSYENSYGLPAVTLTNVAVDGGVNNPGGGNSEVALDIEMAIAMAPGLSKVIVYEAPNPSPWPDLLNRIANDNSARQISCSWGGGSPDATSEQIFKQMAAQGQSFFNASGDSDAFSGSIPFPSDSTNITQVGGTTLTTTGAGGSWSSETVWNWGSNKGKYTGSSGGISTFYPIPNWQLGINMTTNHGSTTLRNVPDVALTADNILVTYNNGQSGIFGGTSAAAPLWAAFTALVNQQAAASQPSVGFINPAVYSIGKGTNYIADFHDITTGNNFTRSSPANFSAVPGYDLCTGWGTPSGTNLINALVPPAFPFFTAQPANLTILSGSNAVFSATVGGATPFVFQWRKNGTNISNGAGISGATSNILALTAVTTNSSGNYTLFVTNNFGSVTSSIAALTVVLPPAITSSSLTNRTVQCGSNNLAFTVTASGTPPLNFQWSLDGAPVSGATNASLSFTNLHLPNHTVSVVVTNPYASIASNALVTVLDTLAPVITLNGGNPLFVELGSSFTDPGAAATDVCAGSLSVSISGTVNTNAVGTNTLTYTAADGNGNTNTAARTVIVHDTTPPVVSWSFTNLVLATGTNCSAAMPGVTGTNYILATDLSGALAISQTPTNNFILSLGTNAVVITVADNSGNTAFSTNTIVVQDETPPVILLQPQSRTNTVGTTANFIAAATACTPVTFQWFFNSAVLTNETGSTLTLSNLTTTNAGNYSVIATASGGSTTSAVVTLTVNLIPPAISAAAVNPDGSFNLSLGGTPGRTYILEAKTDLFPSAIWLPLATNTLGSGGVWQFSDTITNNPRQFYRLKLAP